MQIRVRSHLRNWVGSPQVSIPSRMCAGHQCDIVSSHEVALDGQAYASTGFGPGNDKTANAESGFKIGGIECITVPFDHQRFSVSPLQIINMPAFPAAPYKTVTGMPSPGNHRSLHSSLGTRNLRETGRQRRSRNTQRLETIATQGSSSHYPQHSSHPSPAGSQVQIPRPLPKWLDINDVKPLAFPGRGLIGAKVRPSTDRCALSACVVRAFPRDEANPRGALVAIPLFFVPEPHGLRRKARTSFHTVVRCLIGGLRC